jgi:hypothetical protein
MKILLWSVAASALMLSWVSTLSAAEDIPCLNQAQTQQEVDGCLDSIYTPLMEQIGSEFKRLAEKYKGDEDLQEHLKLARQGWNGYHIHHCAFEEEVAGYVNETKKQIVPHSEAAKSNRRKSLEASKSSSSCVIRTAQEMYAALVKL